MLWLYFIGLILFLHSYPTQCCPGRHESSPRPNRNPVFNAKCGENILQLAAPGKTGAIVSWSADKYRASDPDSGLLSLNLESNQGSRSYFSGLIPGGTQVTYKALDCRGGAAYCNFRVKVTIKYCPSVPPLIFGSRQCTGEQNNVYGSRCASACYPGYQVNGATGVECRGDKTWSAAFPTCLPVSCGPLGDLQNGYVDCSGFTYPAICRVGCSGGFKYQANVTSVRCKKDGKWDHSLYTCHDDEAPTFPQGCPEDQVLTSGYSGLAVTWDDPKTSDNSGQHVALTSIPARGTRLEPGNHTVTITATDLAGLNESCTFRVIITLRTCPTLQIPNGSINCTSGYTLGSWCSLTCLRGYEVKGQPPLTCALSGHDPQWSPAGVSCEVVQCPVPQLPNGRVECPNGRIYAKTCKPTCNQGFSYKGDNPIQCSDNGTWKGLGHCQDEQPPIFNEGCSDNQHVFAAELGQTTRVRWTPPNVTDNSGTFQLSSSHQPGSVFLGGVTIVSYNATDPSGNEDQCNFTVLVTTLLCDPPDFEKNKTYKTMSHNCPDGFAYGATCTLNCTYGYPLVGPSSIVCKRSDETSPPTAFWEWPGPSSIQPKCGESKCPDLQPPSHGSLACHNATYGFDCLMSCQDPYDIPGNAGYGGTGHFYCTKSNGYWTPDTAPDCSVKRRPRQTKIQGDLFYYSDSCNISKDQLRENFITRMNNDAILKDACQNVKSCTVDNVKVHCGSLRKKRDTGSLAEGEENHHVYRRQSANSKSYVLISFDINLNISQNDSGSVQEEHQIYEGVRQRVFTNMKAGVTNGSFNEENLFLNPSDAVANPKMTAVCPSGTVARKHSDHFSCVGCSLGNYLSSVSGNCTGCPVGSYSDIDNATNCTPCPPQFSTASAKAKSKSECIERCPPGHLSPTGFAPCQPCLVGQYQPGTGSTRCVQCPVNTWTHNVGATSDQACVDADLVLSNSSVPGTIRRGGISGWTSLTLSLRVAFPGITSSLSLSLHSPTTPSSLLASTLLSAASTVDEVKESKQRMFHNFTFLVITPNVTETPQNVTVLTLCQQLPDLITLTLHSEQRRVMVSSLAVYGGILTPEEIASLGSSCIVNITNNLLTWSPDPTAMQVPSQCDAQDKCSPSPCGDHGLCLYQRGGYECRCQNGWSGTHCEVAPGPCTQHGCQNGATCVPASLNYTCTCPADYTGVFCELQKVKGVWTEWLVWSACSCGGQQTRQRLCTNPSPQNGGQNCTGEDFQFRNCTSTVCYPEDLGKWGTWSAWSGCSVTCKGGQQSRQRSCDPVHGGGPARCQGSSLEMQACSIASCPVPGKWGSWAAWSPCSVTCGQGSQSRQRSCDSPVPAYGGQNCTGTDTDSQSCPTVQCPECKTLDRPPGGKWTCEVVSQTPYLQQCNLTCLTTYTLADPTSRVIRCGQDTSYLWDHQRKTDKRLNSVLQASPPACARAHTVRTATYSAKTSMNTDCDPSKAPLVTKAVTDNIDNNVPCRSQGLCPLTVATGCQTVSGKRSTPTLTITVNATLTVNITDSQLQSNATAWAAYQDQMSVVNQSVPDNTTTLQSLLTVSLPDGQTVGPNMATLNSSLAVTCSPGLTVQGFVCAECPAGTMEQEGVCVQCPLGFYQNQPASTSCQSCPFGLSWDLPGAPSVQHCAFKLEELVSTTPQSTTTFLPSTTAAHPGTEPLDNRLLIGLSIGIGAFIIFASIIIGSCIYAKQTSRRQRYSGQGSWISMHSRVFPANSEDVSSPSDCPGPVLKPVPVLPSYEDAVLVGTAPRRHTMTTPLFGSTTPDVLILTDEADIQCRGLTPYPLKDESDSEDYKVGEATEGQLESQKICPEPTG